MPKVTTKPVLRHICVLTLKAVSLQNLFIHLPSIYWGTFWAAVTVLVTGVLQWKTADNSLLSWTVHCRGVVRNRPLCFRAKRQLKDRVWDKEGQEFYCFAGQRRLQQTTRFRSCKHPPRHPQEGPGGGLYGHTGSSWFQQELCVLPALLVLLVLLRVGLRSWDKRLRREEESSVEERK